MHRTTYFVLNLESRIKARNERLVGFSRFQMEENNNGDYTPYEFTSFRSSYPAILGKGLECSIGLDGGTGVRGLSDGSIAIETTVDTVLYSRPNRP